MSKATAKLVAGRNGGRAVAWIAGEPQGLSRQYVFPPNVAIEVTAADAAALAAGTIETGGRRFVVTGGESAAPKPETKPAAAMAPSAPEAKA